MEENPHLTPSQTGTDPLGSLGNPICVNGISGEFNYLNRLVTLARVPFFFHRLGSRSQRNQKPVDVYELVAQDNSEHWVLAISHYHLTASEEAPEGLLLAPNWPYLEKSIGVNNCIKDFPAGLLEARKEENPALTELIESLLSQFTPEEWRTQAFSKLLAPVPIHTWDDDFPPIED